LRKTVESDYEPVARLEAEVLPLSKTYSDLQEHYQQKRSALQSYERTIDSYDLGIGTIDSVTYEPIYEGRELSVLEAHLEDVKHDIKALVSDKRACSRLPSDMVINGRKGAAKTFVNREIRLRIRCLDNEVKAAIADVQWNNVNRIIDRVSAKFEEINDDSKMVKIFLTAEYLELKLREIRLTYELNQLKESLKAEEREERQRLREEQRDEQRVKNDLAKAERDRVRLEKLVEQELSKIGEAKSSQREKLVLLQKELEILKGREARAKSLAQQTRAGYVYIVSNKTAFGEGICKIGMTRRLDPKDRVKELGDASVPELFTAHSFIYTDDAPKLEKHLHSFFNDKRVNLINRRKEFFRLEPDEALTALDDYKGTLKFEATA